MGRIKDKPDPHGIRRRLADRGRTAAELARHLHMDPSQLQRTMSGSRSMKATEMLGIEEFFGGETAERFQSYAVTGRGPERIPIFGYAMAGSADHIAFNDGQIVEWVEPPPVLITGGEFFGVRVLNDSMEPRYFAGEVALAQRHLPPARDRDCLVEFIDGSGVLKTYKGQHDGFVFCRQWNPDQEVRFEATKVKALHAIVWRR